ncbi:uncharacterized protein LOC122251555 [Penaeus japonicus]|uniref:uncharacterized protein LOC122251555 n=1 Tax=Penaeus japonicus TaxID=27405 RepID=UPI001C70DECF|nr:uncharacterized protein LOC122251555 [Penaeus japonicus]
MIKDAMRNFEGEGRPNIISFLENMTKNHGRETTNEEDGLGFLFGDLGDSEPNPTNEDDAVSDASTEDLNFLEIFNFSDEAKGDDGDWSPAADDNTTMAAPMESLLLEVLRNDNSMATARNVSLEEDSEDLPSMNGVDSERVTEEKSNITEVTGSELRGNASTLVPLGQTDYSTTEPAESWEASPEANGTKRLQIPSTDLSLQGDQKKTRKKRSTYSKIMHHYYDFLDCLTPEQVSRHIHAIVEMHVFMKEMVLSSRRRSIRDTPMAPEIGAETGVCRVFNMTCAELPPLSACRGVSLGGCLSYNKLHLFMMPRYILAICILLVAVVSIGSIVAAFEMYRRVTNRRVVPVVEETVAEEMTQSNNPANGC